MDPQNGGLIWSGEPLPFSSWIKLSGHILVSCNIGGTVVRTRYAETCSPGECEKEGGINLSSFEGEKMYDPPQLPERVIPEETS